MQIEKEPELKTLEWDILNPDLLTYLEIKKKSGLSINPNIHHSKVFSSGVLDIKDISRSNKKV